MTTEFLSSTDFIDLDIANETGLEWWKSALVCGSVAGICGLGVILCGFHNAYLSYRVNNTGIRTVATILSKIKDTSQYPIGPIIYRIRYMYCDYLNTKRYGISELDHEEYTDFVIGEQMNIKYDPLNPNISRLVTSLLFDEHGNEIINDDDIQSTNWICMFIIHLIIGIAIICGCIYYVNISTYNDQILEALFAMIIISILLSLIVVSIKCYDAKTFCFGSNDNYKKERKGIRISSSGDLQENDSSSDDSDFSSQEQNVRVHVSIQGTDRVWVIVDVLCPVIRGEFSYDMNRETLEDAVQKFVNEYECLEYETLIQKEIVEMVECELDGYQTDYA